jgi:heme exporter protein D
MNSLMILSLLGGYAVTLLTVTTVVQETIRTRHKYLAQTERDRLKYAAMQKGGGPCA